MIVTNFTEARATLAALMDRVTQDVEEVRITRRGKPDVVLIAATELAGLKETAYLLRSPANAARLLASIEGARRGEGVVISDEDFAAMRREVEALAESGTIGGVSPTLERLIREQETAEAAGVPRDG